MNSAAHLGDANSKDGMRAAARGIHGCAACGAMCVAKGHKILHVIVVVNQAFRQICTQSDSCGLFFCLFNAGEKKKKKNSLTLNVWAVQRVLSHSQHSIPACSFLEKIVHALIIDLQIAGTKLQLSYFLMLTFSTQN